MALIHSKHVGQTRKGPLELNWSKVAASTAARGRAFRDLRVTGSNGEHGQVVIGFVNNAQMHIYHASLKGFPMQGLKLRSDDAVPAECEYTARNSALDPFNSGLVFSKPGRPYRGSDLWVYEQFIYLLVGNIDNNKHR